MRELVLRNTEKGRKPARPSERDIDLSAVAAFMQGWGFECRVVEVINEDIDGKRQCVLCMEMHPVEAYTLTKARKQKVSAQLPGHSRNDARVHVVRVCPECLKTTSWNAGTGVTR